MSVEERNSRIGVAPPRDRVYDLVSLGECMVELWSDEPLGTVDRLHRSYGGDAPNALVTASRLGSRTASITRVGDDDLPLLIGPV